MSEPIPTNDKVVVPFPADDTPFSDAEVQLLLGGSPERHSDKVQVEEDDEQELERPVRPPKDPNVTWLNGPSIPDQMQRLPNTVRPGPRIDAVFNLSNKDELMEFNKIQAEASNHVDGLTSIIHDLDKQFHQGQFFALITYSKLFYQKL